MLLLTAWVFGSQNKNSSGTRSGTELLFLGSEGVADARPDLTDGVVARVGAEQAIVPVPAGRAAELRPCPEATAKPAPCERVAPPCPRPEAPCQR
jgi:hypothetical protein